MRRRLATTRHEFAQDRSAPRRGATVALLAVLAATFSLAAGSATSTASEAPSPAHLLNPHSGLCLNVKGGGDSPGTPTEIWECDNKASQQWVIREDGTVYNTATAMCLSVENNSTHEGARTEIWKCTGDEAMQWEYREDGTLYNANSSLCLNTRSHRTTPGTPTEIWHCDKSRSERWVMHH
ncbi:RICIN domain-containing protein [Streptomyces luteolus]|uniref:RICIN domain-containing protein n=1 Tax=Streptomyces luteolus TaxID=3043615 RepID=A0ABT6T1E8_9ACTN|nr:RICIN domain-containing protein [Streptomyces sp. B-S-A12]MDI3421664.1 RICIN domain-containing protein [Streptomyces sp. B-S-A12]